MTSENPHHPKTKRKFSGCVELIPPQPAFIEFITANRLWALPISQLEYFTWGENPEPHGQKNLPSDLLLLVFQTRLVLLFGWRLELLVGPLVSGRVARVHAGHHPGTLMIKKAWVSEIKNIPRFDSIKL